MRSQEEPATHPAGEPPTAFPTADAAPDLGAAPSEGTARPTHTVNDPTRPGPRWLAALVLLVATVCAYLPSLPGDFFWDDDSYVTENEVLRDPDGWRTVWTPRETPQYYPVVFSVLWLEYQAFGLDPLGYHVVNLVLHALSGLLVWALFTRLRVRGSWWIGAAFALHPLHVETVAWTMELKNVLSGFFYLLAAHAYLAFDSGAFDGRVAGRGRASMPGRVRLALLWAAGLAAFACALFSKTVTCTLPAALVLALLWRRAPLRGGLRLLPLVPFFALGAQLALYTARLEAEFVGAQGTEFLFTAPERLLIATRAALFYTSKLLVPGTFLFQYPRWEIDATDPWAWWSVAVIVVLLAALAWAALRGRRGPLLAALFFGGTISPALGFVNFYPMIFSFVADHFCYLASLGVLAVVGAVLARLPHRVPVGLGVLLLVGLGARTAARAADFSSAEGLYRHTLEHNDGAWLAHSALGSLELNTANEFLTRGDFAGGRPGLEAARGHFEAAIALYGKRFPDHFNLALTLERLGDVQAALVPALEAARIKPLLARPRGLAGMLLVRAGRPREAVEHLNTALELEPANPLYLEALGSAYGALGNAARARDFYRGALESSGAPADRIRIGARLAGLLARTEDASVRAPEEALELVRELSRLVPQVVPQLEEARADALFAVGRHDAARALAEQLLEIARRTGIDDFVRQAEERIERMR